MAIQGLRSVTTSGAHAIDGLGWTGYNTCTLVDEKPHGWGSSSVRAQTYLRLSNYHLEKGNYHVLLCFMMVYKFWVWVSRICASLYLHTISHLMCCKTFLERWNYRIKLLAIFRSTNFGCGVREFVLLSNYLPLLTFCVARPSSRDGIIASNCLQFVGLQILGLGASICYLLCCLLMTSLLMSCLKY